MTWNPELNTDDVSEDQLEEWAGRFNTCNAFAFWYVENVNENAVVKDALVFSDEHCYVYDRDLDVTIDATLGQFEELPAAGAWDGDEHPHEDGYDEVYEWETREEFEQHYDELNGPFIL